LTFACRIFLLEPDCRAMNLLKDMQMPAAKGAQRRKDKRINSVHRVDYSTGPIEFSKMTKTLSAGGIYISTPNPLPPESRIYMRIHFDPDQEDFIVVEGVVRYSQPRRGMGIKFVNMREEDRNMINTHVESHWWQEA